MDMNLLIWFAGFALVMYVFDRLMTKWIERNKDCPDVYSETGVENENTNDIDNIDNSGNK